MRIISGRWKGKRITAPRQIEARPTTNFAKEGLFNILHHCYGLSETRVLDLFAGIGSISFEFLSRDAQEVWAVESSRDCVQFLNHTAEVLLDEAQNLMVIKSDVFIFLEKNSEKGFDFVFADPPFAMARAKYDELIRLVLDSELLVENGLFILEHSSEELNFEEHPRCMEYKKYGQVAFTFFQ